MGDDALSLSAGDRSNDRQDRAMWNRHHGWSGGAKTGSSASLALHRGKSAAEDQLSGPDCERKPKGGPGNMRPVRVFYAYSHEDSRCEIGFMSICPNCAIRTKSTTGTTETSPQVLNGQVLFTNV